MLGYMGFWAWQNRQIELAKGEHRNKKNEPMGEKGIKTHLLDKLLDRLQDIQSQGGLTTDTKKSRRSRIITKLYIGKKLSTKLVKELRLGILFSHDIWKYLKLSMKELNKLIAEFKKDAQQMKLLRILRPQLERLVNDGSSHLHKFYEDLRDNELITKDELTELRINYPAESDALPPGALDAAVKRLKKLIASEVLKKDSLDKTDAIRVNKRIELTCDMFNRLYPGEWLDCWTINVAMALSDKPTYVRFGISVPLEETINDQLREVERPLARWSKTIANHQQEARETSGKTVPLVHFCPINHNNHFTLLKINEREKVIRHYDSMAKPGTISGRNKTKISRLVKKEFSNLGFHYTEAVSIQYLLFRL
ncbi:uncharacterized protein CDV56_102077 [Aspergillus thermomutatus]|uniref:Ubiquitin-like protease family profile domain-containing protein n=1 Tax=Aspergillus thermomutatus TaxID=41047 RepID=A0A397G8F9_ASPTH|nr:uncharacterized protein CDV56_102077 [Aspergillus thermomutatus]RHZ45233.1 hypothetical protein CDV56_102077 [Aspergillus thermomutatus]